MKYLFALFILLFHSPLYALSHRDFVRLSPKQKIQFISVHKKFFQDISSVTKLDHVVKTTSNRFRLIDFAFADTGYDCFYAGWPSKLVSSGESSLCSSPANHNPHYANSAGNCSENELKCQPLLFGDNLCADASTPQMRNLAYSQCEQKFQSAGRTLTELANELSQPEKGQMFNELFALVEEVCTNGVQSVKPMCDNLKNKVTAIKNLNPSDSNNSTEQALVGAVENVTNISNVVNNTLTTLTSCMPAEKVSQPVTPPLLPPVQRAPTAVVSTNESNPFPRITREVSAECGTARPGDGYIRQFIFDCSQSSSNSTNYPNGFSFRSKSGHPHANVSSLYEDGSQPYRQIEFESANHALNETFLYIIDSAGGPDSHDVKSVMFLLPRRTIPSVEVVGNVLRTTLATGEIVEIDKNTNAILSGALREGPLDLNTNRHQRTPPNVHYQGSGISVRLDHRFEYPTQGATHALIQQGSRTCRVPRDRLFNSEGDLISQSDQEFLNAINRSCQNRFSL